MTLGSAFGAAEAASDFNWIQEGEPLSPSDVQDAFADEWEIMAAEDVDWRTDKPADLKDAGARSIPAYHRDVITITDDGPVLVLDSEQPKQGGRPVEAERQARFDVLHPDGSEIGFIAYLDVETDTGEVIDRKLTGKKWNRKQVNHDQQPTSYLTARRAEGNPAE